MERLICIVIGYIFGLIQSGYLYGKANHMDIRQYGSGNAGSTNVLRVMGKKAGAIVFLGDFFKAVLAMAVCRLLFKGNADVDLLALYAGLGVTLGHNFPFYLHFKGGKGIAATAGLILAFHPYFIPVGVILFFGAFLTTHYVSLGSLLVYAGLMIQMVICGQMGLFHAPQAILNEMYILTALLTALAYYKHRENIVRLVKGQERKTYLTKKKKGD